MSENTATKFPNWKNQYIDLVAKEKDYIFSPDNDILEQIARFKLLIEDFDKLYLELGSGSGMHLIELAARDPNNLYIGVELRYKRIFKTAEKARKKGLKNLVLIRINAATIDEWIPKNSLAGIYINFPDPWDKKKWFKHRLINPDSLIVWHQLLQTDAFLAIKSDHLAYFDRLVEDIIASRLFAIESQTNNLYQSEFLANNIATEFEGLFKSKGIAINFLRARRV